MPGGNKRSYHGHTLLHKTAAFSFRLVEVDLKFAPDLKGLTDFKPMFHLWKNQAVCFY